MRTKERLYLRNAELNLNFGKYLLLHIQVVHHYSVVLAGWRGGRRRYNYCSNKIISAFLNINPILKCLQMKRLYTSPTSCRSQTKTRPAQMKNKRVPEQKHVLYK
jgi:hypothetical protein